MNLIMYLSVNMKGPLNVNRRSNGLLLQRHAEIKHSMQTHPQKYTAWFQLAFPKIEEVVEKIDTQIQLLKHNSNYDWLLLYIVIAGHFYSDGRHYLAYP